MVFITNVVIERVCEKRSDVVADLRSLVFLTAKQDHSRRNSERKPNTNHVFMLLVMPAIGGMVASQRLQIETRAQGAGPCRMPFPARLLTQFGAISTEVGASVNEALELAKRYDSEEAASFVNGVIGTFVKQELPQ